MSTIDWVEVKILASWWEAVARITSEEAIRRHRADEKERSLAEVIAPKPRYGNFLEVTRDLCR